MLIYGRWIAPLGRRRQILGSLAAVAASLAFFWLVLRRPTLDRGRDLFDVVQAERRDARGQGVAQTRLQRINRVAAAAKDAKRLVASTGLPVNRPRQVPPAGPALAGDDH